MSTAEHTHGFSGPKLWVTSAIVGLALGAGASQVVPVTAGQTPLWLCGPFALLLLSVAVMPLVAARWWHAHYPDVSFFLGGFVLAFVGLAMGAAGRHDLLHAIKEYYAFFALVGGLYVASGGILIDVRDKSGPVMNTVLLGIGAVLANVIGTTGASMLLIRPFMRMNRGRMRAFHAVFFIFIVSNCGGCLTPIGDPPLYIGYLVGVPFFWTLQTLWPMWLLVNGILLTVFFVMDVRVPRFVESRPIDQPGELDRTLIATSPGTAICLVLIIAGVFIDPMLSRMGIAEGWPVGATFQIIMAVLAYVFARPSIRHANQFTFEPAREVGFLFLGIFITMAPALAYLRVHAPELGLSTPTHFYFATGTLSAMLDNAPTYLSMLQVQLGMIDQPLNAQGVNTLINHTGSDALVGKGVYFLEAVSLGAVFFGAMTYIGNGPNFMVRSIVDATHARAQQASAAPGEKLLGVKMPSFFGYVLYAACLLLPVLVLNWWLFVRGG